MPPSHLLRKNTLQSLNPPLPGVSQDRDGAEDSYGDQKRRERDHQGCRRAFPDVPFKPTVWEKEQTFASIVWTPCVLVVRRWRRSGDGLHLRTSASSPPTSTPSL